MTTWVEKIILDESLYSWEKSEKIEKKVRDAINKLLIGNWAIENLGVFDTSSGKIYLQYLKKELGL